MSLSDPAIKIKPFEELRFHPCFNGWVFQTILNLGDPQRFLVSILVLMDESFRLFLEPRVPILVVSILVLMDESFRQVEKGLSRIEMGFHPCFNGWVFQTVKKKMEFIWEYVSILVLMDESFRHVHRPWHIYTSRICFHPCFNGWVFQTVQRWNKIPTI